MGMADESSTQINQAIWASLGTYLFFVVVPQTGDCYAKVAAGSGRSAVLVAPLACSCCSPSKSKSKVQELEALI